MVKRKKEPGSEKIRFKRSDFKELMKCPWCDSSEYAKWGKAVRGFRTVKCDRCGLIFVQNRLSEEGLAKYYKGYLQQVHQADSILNQQREYMYELEFKLVAPYLKKNSKVLDVGCSGGYFLDIFKKHGHQCYGVEFGEEAAKEASRKHCIWSGKLPDMNIPHKFDLVIFRGVIEHTPQPKSYLEKAIKLLKKRGLIYITSTPNADAFCCELFKENWNQHFPEPHLMHFSPGNFDEYFKNKGFNKINERFFYAETPYANVEEDILKVAEAVRLKKKRKSIKFKSPAFWGNMMSLIYQRQS